MSKMFIIFTKVEKNNFNNTSTYFDESLFFICHMKDITRQHRIQLDILIARLKSTLYFLKYIFEIYFLLYIIYVCGYVVLGYTCSNCILIQIVPRYKAKYACNQRKKCLYFRNPTSRIQTRHSVDLKKLFPVLFRYTVERVGNEHHYGIECFYVFCQFSKDVHEDILFLCDEFYNIFEAAKFNLAVQFTEQRSLKCLHIL